VLILHFAQKVSMCKKVVVFYL